MDLYNRYGNATHYIRPDGTVYTWPGSPVAYLHGNDLYTMAGRHVGRFHDGWVRNPQGEAVLFSDGATGGPMQPMKALKPLKGLPSLAPLRGLPSLPPLAPLPSLNWSTLSFDDLVRS